MKLRNNPSRLQPVGERLKASASRKQTSHAMYGYEWQQARADYLTEHPLCMRCRGLGLVVAASVVDHVTPHHGDSVLFWDRGNWQSLCYPCHNVHKQALERRMDMTPIQRKPRAHVECAQAGDDVAQPGDLTARGRRVESSGSG